MAPVSLQFVDSVSQEWGDMTGMTFCGVKVVTLLQSDSDILQLNGSTLSTRSVTYEDVGTHTFTLQVSMKDHPSAQPLLQTVTYLVNCTVKTLAFSTTFDSF